MQLQNKVIEQLINAFYLEQYIYWFIFIYRLFFNLLNSLNHEIKYPI